MFRLFHAKKKSPSKNKLPLDQLPNDLLKNIGSFLPEASQAQLSEINRQFHRIFALEPSCFYQDGLLSKVDEIVEGNKVLCMLKNGRCITKLRLLVPDSKSESDSDSESDLTFDPNTGSLGDYWGPCELHIYADYSSFARRNRIHNFRREQPIVILKPVSYYTGKPIDILQARPASDQNHWQAVDSENTLSLWDENGKLCLMKPFDESATIELLENGEVAVILYNCAYIWNFLISPDVKLSLQVENPIRQCKSINNKGYVVLENITASRARSTIFNEDGILKLAREENGLHVNTVLTNNVIVYRRDHHTAEITSLVPYRTQPKRSTGCYLLEFVNAITLITEKTFKLKTNCNRDLPNMARNSLMTVALPKGRFAIFKYKATTYEFRSHELPDVQIQFEIFNSKYKSIYWNFKFWKRTMELAYIDNPIAFANGMIVINSDAVLGESNTAIYSLKGHECPRAQLPSDKLKTLKTSFNPDKKRDDKDVLAATLPFFTVKEKKEHSETSSLVVATTPQLSASTQIP